LNVRYVINKVPPSLFIAILSYEEMVSGTNLSHPTAPRKTGVRELVCVPVCGRDNVGHRSHLASINLPEPTEEKREFVVLGTSHYARQDGQFPSLYIFMGTDHPSLTDSHSPWDQDI
jgi:hypothetical protein